eukprot:4867863-Lingulodinium_polyedra.AAC.1
MPSIGPTPAHVVLAPGGETVVDAGPARCNGLVRRGPNDVDHDAVTPELYKRRHHSKIVLRRTCLNCWSPTMPMPVHLVLPLSPWQKS